MSEEIKIGDLVGFSLDVEEGRRGEGRVILIYHAENTPSCYDISVIAPEKDKGNIVKAFTGELWLIDAPPEGPTPGKKGYTEKDLVPGSVWLHLGRMRLYIVTGVALCSTNGDRDQLERSVIYWSLAEGKTNYREIKEFLDGRFMRVRMVKNLDADKYGEHIMPYTISLVEFSQEPVKQ